jgi:hypothetical protein
VTPGGTAGGSKPKDPASEDFGPLCMPAMTAHREIRPHLFSRGRGWLSAHLVEG